MRCLLRSQEERWANNSQRIDDGSMGTSEMADPELRFGASGSVEDVAVCDEYCENCQLRVWQGLICKSCFNVMRCVCVVRTGAPPKRGEEQRCARICVSCNASRHGNDMEVLQRLASACHDSMRCQHWFVPCSARQWTLVGSVNVTMISAQRGNLNLHDKNPIYCSRLPTSFSTAASSRRKPLPRLGARVHARHRSRMSDKTPALIAFDLDGTLWYASPSFTDRRRFYIE